MAAKRQQELEQKRKLEQQRHEEQEKHRLEQQLLLLRNKEKGKESRFSCCHTEFFLFIFLFYFIFFSFEQIKYNGNIQFVINIKKKKNPYLIISCGCAVHL